MYKVQISIVKNGIQKRTYNGVYIEPDKPTPIPEMRMRCLEHFYEQTLSHEPLLENARMELTIFKKMTTDFIYDDRKQ